MTYKKFRKYLDVYHPIKKRGSGISITTLRNLQDLKMVKLVKLPLKSGKEPKNPNAFELTLLGRDVIRRALNQQQPLNEVVSMAVEEINKSTKELSTIQDQINNLQEKIINIEDLLNSVLTNNIGISKQQVKQVNVTNELKQVQQTASRENILGQLVSVDLFFKHLKQISGMSDKQINNKLYQLFEQNKVDLQMGPDNGGKVVTSPSGKKFGWAKVLV